ncbi:MAG: Holliday junction branch migration protein RuvA [Pseudomonadales bacterium]
MIGWLSGNFVEVNEGTLLLDVGGVGYELEVTSGVLGTLLHSGQPKKGLPLALFTHLIVREDAQLLYGFDSKAQRDLFRVLIRVNGVGPKLALSLLSALSINELAHAVNRQETAPLTRISGVGKKTAERLLVELKDKVDVGLEAVILPHQAAEVSTDADSAIDALLSLGYKPAEAAGLVSAVTRDHPEQTLPAEELVRLALRSYARQNASG